MPVSGSTGSAVAEAASYASAEEAFAALELLQVDVETRLRALEGGPGRAFAASLLRDLDRHRLERETLRRERGLEPRPRVASAPADPGSALEDLRAAQEKLTYALAEALPVLDPPRAVRMLARQMVDLSRHQTLVGLWVEAEELRG
jgi:hypothetical protein